MPTEIIIRDGVVQSLSGDPLYVFDASRNADVADNYTWADINLTGIYTMDSRYKTTDTNTLRFSRNNYWAYVESSPLRYSGPADVYYPSTLDNTNPPNVIIAKIRPTLSANTQYSLIQACNTIRNVNAVTGNQSVRRYAPNDISWFAYAMTIRMGTGTNVIIDCRSGRKYVSVTITNFDFTVAHVFATDGNVFYLDGTVIATVTAIQIDNDGFTDVNAPNKANTPSSDNTPYVSSTLFSGTKGYNFTTNFGDTIYYNIYAITAYFGSMLELQYLACYRYGATLTTPVFTATAQATLSTSQVVVFNNATFSGTIKII